MSFVDIGDALQRGGVEMIHLNQTDPGREVGILAPSVLAAFADKRAGELERFSWIAGDWSYENVVPPTSVSPGYRDVGRLRFVLDGGWVCTVTDAGMRTRWITFDPLSGQWFYVLTGTSFGLLRSSEGWTDAGISFSGPMTMIGLDREWRMTWTTTGRDAFKFVNEERVSSGDWVYIDEWRFSRLPAGN